MGVIRFFGFHKQHALRDNSFNTISYANDTTALLKDADINELERNVI